MNEKYAIEPIHMLNDFTCAATPIPRGGDATANPPAEERVLEGMIARTESQLAELKVRLVALQSQRPAQAG